ncbi:phage tail protein [Serratia marcescens]|uniref:phage tail protein n=1 Tax=Serratia marcescens TaxID=615 RepID=UPI004045EEED
MSDNPTPDSKALASSITLPSWMRIGEPLKLAKACLSFWTTYMGWVYWPLRQLDPQTCSEWLLDVLAYQRDISRFVDEPLDLYRKRVTYAFVNAQDAGEVAGFIAIFERLGIGHVEIEERMPDQDWDVIGVTVTDNQITGNADLLMEIIRHYGRTCRRYEFRVMTSEHQYIRAGWDGGEYQCYGASLKK